MNNIKNPSPNVMNTWTGRQFDPLHMQPSDVSLEDIAHALSLLCRGGGHLDRFYSVGQHCINCAGEARARGQPLADLDLQFQREPLRPAETGPAPSLISSVR